VFASTWLSTKDLLQLFRDAGFGWVFIGIESTDPASLKETLKTQNLHEDTLTSVRRIYSYGIEVPGRFIIGFDNDTLKTFRAAVPVHHRRGNPSAMIGAAHGRSPRQPLYDRLKKDGRQARGKTHMRTLGRAPTSSQRTCPTTRMVDGYIAL